MPARSSPCFAFFASSSKLSCLFGARRRQRRGRRSVPSTSDAGGTTERGRSEEGSTALFYIFVEAIVVALSPAARDALRSGGNGKGRRGRRGDPCVFLAQQRDDGTMRAMWDGCMSVARRSRSVERRPFLRCRPSVGAALGPSRSLGVQCGNKI